MQIPFQQTKEWQKLQQDLGETTFCEENDDFTFLAILKHTKMGNYLYLPYGPYLANKNAAKKAFNRLQELAKEKSAIFIRIEPQSAKNAEFLLNLPNCKKTIDLNPKETWVLDISPSIDDLYPKMKQNTRNLCRNYSKKGITVSVSDDSKDIDYLVKFQEKLAQDKNIGVFSKNYLKTELNQPFASLYLAKIDGKTVAAALFFDDETTRYYMQAATDPKYRNLPCSYGIINEAIIGAKAKNLQRFDFWGIAPENSSKNHPWAGFTTFKKSFGGEQVEYAGTYDIVFSRFKYELYRVFRRINRLKRRA